MKSNHIEFDTGKSFENKYVTDIMVDMNEMNIFSIRIDNKDDCGSFTGNFDTSLFKNNSISKIKTSDIEEFMNKMFEETVP